MSTPARRPPSAADARNEALHQELRARNAERRLAAVEAENVALRARLAALEAENAELRERLSAAT